MPLSVGDKIGHYEVLSLLGEGGMGEVYKARDTTLKRDVALKVLPASFLRDSERMARFQREAEVLASLDHPNVGPIYGIVDSEDSRGLVLALIEGPTLADQIALGPLPLDDALSISKQIIEALEYAHDRGVVHRDLKPANIKITPEGVVKVLDFGLAKVLEDEPPKSSLGNSPTMTLGHTRAGMILGTAAYMSPEQAIGRPVDRRSDIFSFGAVLFEMLTGQRAFPGATAPDVLESVVKNDPDWSVLPPGTPAHVRKLLERTLQKDRKQRLQAIGEARIALANPDRREPGAIAVPSHSRVGSLLWIGVILAICALALGFVAYRHASEEAPRMVKLFLPPPDRATFTGQTLPAVSPDGRHVAFTAALDGKTELWVRELDALSSRLLPGTAGAFYPFWSPDSRFIGFFADGKLKKIDVAGGPALTLCDTGAAGAARGATWSRDDVIVFMPDYISNRHLLRVSAAGGPVTPLPVSASEGSYRFPWFLPDGQHFLYTINSQDVAKTGIHVGDLDSKTSRLTAAVASNAIYAAGYLLFLRERTLMAQPFDAAKAQTAGDAAPIAEQVDYVVIDQRGHFSASQNVLAYISGSLYGSGFDERLTWFDRTGTARGTVGTPGSFRWPAISPDGATIAVDRLDSQTATRDLWLSNTARGAESRFTFGPPQRQYPVWSPNGGQIAFLLAGDLYQKATSNVVPEEALDASKSNRRPVDWSRDGRYILEETPSNPKTKEDIWVLPLFGDKKPFPFLETEFSERWAKLSPNGQWLAYSSDESKRNEVYVQTFPAHGGKWQVSTSGGDRPVWSRDGRELFFISADNKMMAVEVKNSNGQFQPDTPKPLFETRLSSVTGYDVAKDGRFLIPVPMEQRASSPMVVVLNWTAALKK